MNNVGEIINTEEIIKKSREFDANELLYLLKNSKGIYVFWSWGAHNFVVDKKNGTRMFRMTVNGHHHKGYVYIFLNFLDLFDVYLTTKDGTIVKKTEGDGLYFDELVDWIDENVEKVPEYDK